MGDTEAVGDSLIADLDCFQCGFVYTLDPSQEKKKNINTERYIRGTKLTGLYGGDW